MKGLSGQIESGIKAVIQGLNYDIDIDYLDDDKMKAVIDSKISSLNSAKKMINKWVSSPNAPTTEKLRFYVEEIVSGGEKALEFLRNAFEHEIDYDELENHKINAAVKAKPMILDFIFELDYL